MHSSHPFEPALFEAIVEQIPDAVIFADRDQLAALEAKQIS